MDLKCTVSNKGNCLSSVLDNVSFSEVFLKENMWEFCFPYGNVRLYCKSDIVMHFKRFQCDSKFYLSFIGNTISLDICSLHSDNKHIRFTFSLAYGFLGDVLKTSEQNRWMGPKRYKWGAARRLWKLRWHNCV